MTLTLFCYVTLTSHDLETTTKQLAGHMLVINDTSYLIVHYLVQMLCTNLDCLCWLAAMLDLRENRAFAMEGFLTVNRNGTNELISGDKPFIAILSNLRCLFTRLSPSTLKDIIVRAGPEKGPLV